MKRMGHSDNIVQLKYQSRPQLAIALCRIALIVDQVAGGCLVQLIKCRAPDRRCRMGLV